MSLFLVAQIKHPSTCVIVEAIDETLAVQHAIDYHYRNNIGARKRASAGWYRAVEISLPVELGAHCSWSNDPADHEELIVYAGANGTEVLNRNGFFPAIQKRLLGETK